MRNILSIRRKQKLPLKLFLYVSISLLIYGCKTADVSVEVHGQITNNEMKVSLECYSNAMPMSSGGAYVIITATSVDSVFYENVKIVELKAIGSNGAWNAEKFDDITFSGKGLAGYKNVARDFDVKIGTPSDFEVTMEYESGLQKKYEVKGVRFETVH